MRPSCPGYLLHAGRDDLRPAVSAKSSALSGRSDLPTLRFVTPKNCCIMYWYPYIISVSSQNCLLFPYNTGLYPYFSFRLDDKIKSLTTSFDAQSNHIIMFSTHYAFPASPHINFPDSMTGQ